MKVWLILKHRDAASRENLANLDRSIQEQKQSYEQGLDTPSTQDELAGPPADRDEISRRMDEEWRAKRDAATAPLDFELDTGIEAVFDDENLGYWNNTDPTTAGQYGESIQKNLVREAQKKGIKDAENMSPRELAGALGMDPDQIADAASGKNQTQNPWGLAKRTRTKAQNS